MCGICGILYKEPGRAAEPSLIERMTSTLEHRGPDDTGYYVHNNVALGHRRLSIIDLQLGHQPIANEDETVWIAYNGEIYNHAALRRELEHYGHRYGTNSDTETIVHSFEQYGADCVQHLRGMFAFAIYDENRDSLFIARDRLGIKPLYYVDTPKFFAFASEIKALLVMDEIRREIDYSALAQILTLKFTSDDSTLFRGIKKLEPGHHLTMERGQLTCHQYWDVDKIAQDPAWTEQDAVARLRSMVDESIRLRLMSDVPLGMFLSGGIDSTIISTRMAKMVDRSISTFSVAFREREANELYYARLAAKHARADQHEVTISPEEFFDQLPRMVYHEDEPIAHPSSIALYFVSRLAAQHVKVVLTGEGSDELFGGYERYYQTLNNLKVDSFLSPKLSRALRRGIFHPVLNALPYKFPLRNKAVRTVLYLEPDVESIFLDNYSTFSRAHLGQLLRGDALKSIDPARVYDGYMRHFHRPQDYSLLNRFLYADIKTYLLELLMKQDQMSMAASIESRVPFLDHHLVEFAFTLPDSLKIKGLATKRILRMAFGLDIPQEILHRPKKGFPVPIRRWFGGKYHDVAKRVILAEDSLCPQIINPDAIRRLFDLHREGKYNYSDQIWTLLNLELWHKIFIRRIEIDSINLHH